MRRERMATRFESQVLREFVAQEDHDQALRVFLRRIVPNPEEGFAAFLEKRKPDFTRAVKSTAAV